MVADRKRPGVDRCRDAGLALVLLCLVSYQVWKLSGLIPLAIAVLLISMTCPRILKPFAILWFGLSEALGAVVPKVLLAALFFALVLPVGLLRRALGRDAMQLKRWQQGGGSVFRVRDHRFVAEDLEHPY